MLRICILFFILQLLLPGAYRLEVLQTIAVGPIDTHGIYRVTSCPNGAAIATSSAGLLQVMLPSGAVISNPPAAGEITDTTASTCDSRNRLWTGGAGVVKVFQVSGTGELTFQRGYTINGSINRILVLDDQFYVLGLFRAGDRHEILRRFSLDGKLLGIIPIDLPVWSGGAVNQLVLNGTLLKAGTKVIYIPANPLKFWVFNASDGRLENVIQPDLPGFANIDPSVISKTPLPRWRAADWAFNAVTTSDGRIVLQVIQGRNAPQAPGLPPAWLQIYDSGFRLLAGNIATAEAGLHLTGIDSEDNLYFSTLSVPSGGTIRKARLAQ